MNMVLYLSEIASNVAINELAIKHRWRGCILYLDIGHISNAGVLRIIFRHPPGDNGRYHV